MKDAYKCRFCGGRMTGFTTQFCVTDCTKSLLWHPTFRAESKKVDYDLSHITALRSGIDRAADVVFDLFAKAENFVVDIWAIPRTAVLIKQTAVDSHGFVLMAVDVQDCAKFRLVETVRK